jgi:hypothetical protein
MTKTIDNKGSITREVSIEQTLKDTLIIFTGVTNGREWTSVGVNKGSGFDKDLVAICQSLGCRVITCGAIVK